MRRSGRMSIRRDPFFGAGAAFFWGQVLDPCHEGLNGGGPGLLTC